MSPIPNVAERGRNLQAISSYTYDVILRKYEGNPSAFARALTVGFDPIFLPGRAQHYADLKRLIDARTATNQPVWVRWCELFEERTFFPYRDQAAATIVGRLGDPKIDRSRRGRVLVLWSLVRVGAEFSDYFRLRLPEVPRSST